MKLRGNSMYGLSFNKKSNIELIEIKEPELCTNGAIIELIASGVCGTDLHIINRIKFDKDVILGHEFYGKVIDLCGESKIECLNGNVEIGDYVTVIPGKVCNECEYCEFVPEHKNYCSRRETFGLNVYDEKNEIILGGNTQKLFIPNGYKFFKINKDWPIGLGTLLEPVSVSIKSVNTAFKYATTILERRMTAVVIGVGTIGFFICMALKKRGVNVVVIDKNVNRLNLVKKYGIKFAYTPEEMGELEFIQFTKHNFNGIKSDIVFECAGDPMAFNSVLKYARKGGCVIEVGNFINLGNCCIAPSEICNNELRIIGCVLAEDDYYFEAECLINDFSSESSDLITNYNIKEYELALNNAFIRNNLKINFIFK